MKQKAVQPGQLYRSREGGVFGGHGREWQVVSVARHPDGLNYATLATISDPSLRKALAVGAPMDNRIYTLVACPPADDLTRRADEGSVGEAEFSVGQGAA